MQATARRQRCDSTLADTAGYPRRERPKWTVVAGISCLLQKLKCDDIAPYAPSTNGAQALCTKESQALSTR